MTSTGTEIYFEVRETDDGGFWARALGESIFTQASTWDELLVNLKEAISVHFSDSEIQPKVLNLQFRREVVINL